MDEENILKVCIDKLPIELLEKIRQFHHCTICFDENKKHCYNCNECNIIEKNHRYCKVCSKCFPNYVKFYMNSTNYTKFNHHQHCHKCNKLMSIGSNLYSFSCSTCQEE